MTSHPRLKPACQPEAKRTPSPVLSGMQPSADSLHLGNYLGALRQLGGMQDEYDAVFFIPDLHAITVPQDPAELAKRTRITAAQYIAGGVDVDKCTFFVQSQVPEHAQLAWVLNCITGFGEASRMTQFKDKAQKQGSDHASVGLFTYPILQAADILLYQPHGVPVGEDQRQHVELSRNLAKRFNSRFGETFTVPEATIQKESAKIYDLQNPTPRCPSRPNPRPGLINLLDDPKIVAKRIKSAVTDTGDGNPVRPEKSPGVSNLLTIYSAITGKSVESSWPTTRARCTATSRWTWPRWWWTWSPIRDRANELMADPAELDRLLAHGADKAREIASATLATCIQGGLPAVLPQESSMPSSKVR
jgi:tryptophanyl-tRNA synthetase